jgi:hypothetical protein
MQTLGAELRKMQAECDTRNTRLIGHHELDGSGDGMQIIKVGQYAYVAHVGKMALSILDVSDPQTRACCARSYANTHNHKVQIRQHVIKTAVHFLPAGPTEAPVTGLNVYNLDDP